MTKRCYCQPTLAFPNAEIFVSDPMKSFHGAVTAGCRQSHISELFSAEIISSEVKTRKDTVPVGMLCAYVFKLDKNTYI